MIKNAHTLRVRFDAILACKTEDCALKGAAEAIISTLSKRYGGASAHAITGSWSIEGNDDKPAYRNIAIESGFRIALSVLESASSTAYQDLQEAIKEAIQEYDLPAKYIHVERTMVEVMHFEASTLHPCGIR